MSGAMTREDGTQELIRRAQSGDREAFDELVAFHRKELESFIGSRLGAALQGRFEVADVVQETLLKAFRSLSSFEWRGERSFPRWLVGIANHLILHLARKYRGAERLGLQPEVPGDSDSPSRNLRREERFDRLQESLDRLSPEHREVIVLTRIEGLSVEEVSRRINRSPKAARQLLWRALRSLRKSFGDTESLSLPDRHLDQEGDR